PSAQVGGHLRPMTYRRLQSDPDSVRRRDEILEDRGPSGRPADASPFFAARDKSKTPGLRLGFNRLDAELPGGHGPSMVIRPDLAGREDAPLERGLLLHRSP